MSHILQVLAMIPTTGTNKNMTQASTVQGPGCVSSTGEVLSDVTCRDINDTSGNTALLREF